MTYDSTILAEASLVSYWELQETTGTTAADSKGGNAGTYTGAYTLSQAGADNGFLCATFGPANGYIDIPTSSSLNQTGDFTIEAWVSVTDFSSYRHIFNKTPSGSANAAPYGLYLNTGTMAPVINIGNGSANFALVGTKGFLDSQWHHVAATFVSSTNAVALYLDGVSIGTGTNNVTPTGGTGNAKIGARNDLVANQNMHGRIDSVALYNSALSLGSLQAHIAARTGSPNALLTKLQVEVLTDAVPLAHVTQEATELLITATANARLTQEAVELLLALSPNARLTQEAIEALVLANPNVRLTQEAIEVLGVPNATLRVTQAGVEVLATGTPAARVTQAGIEVLAKVPRSRFQAIVLLPY